MIFLRLGIVAAIQTLVLLNMVWDRAEILRDGAVVELKTQPVDPRSLFRGYYVDLNYEINRLDLDKLEGDSTFERWQTVYVALEEQADHWSAASVFKNWPKIIGDQVILKGTISYIEYDADCQFDNLETCEAKTLVVQYGIDSYFVPELDGKKIEQSMAENRDSFRVSVSIDKDGQAAIRGLKRGGDWLYKEPPY